MRRAAKRDGNHQHIRDGLRDAGYLVEDSGSVGDGWPDIIVMHRGSRRIRFMEIKDPAQPRNKRKLTPAEAEFAARWGDTYVVVETLEQAIEAMRS